VFAAGENETQDGVDLFDVEAARLVMADYDARGVDVMIDLEHESLDRQPARPDSRDARGWAQLELRNGELWAVNVRWTPDGKRRLQEKTQRYISPAFLRDAETGRVERLVNVAIVAMPATFDAPALVAASARTRGLGSRNSTPIGVRFQIVLRDLVEREAAKRGITAGAFVRDAVAAALALTPVEKPHVVNGAWT
jgi:phage I-like protein